MWEGVRGVEVDREGVGGCEGGRGRTGRGEEEGEETTNMYKKRAIRKRFTRGAGGGQGAAGAYRGVRR